MKLSRKESIKTYQVQATFRQKVKFPPFVAILTYISEQGEITAQQLHQDFLGNALTDIACENLLNRLAAIDYLTKEADIFHLTAAGQESVRTEEIYLPQTALMNISICESALIPQKVVKIEIFTNGKGVEKTNEGKKRKFDKVELGKIIGLENGSFIFETFEEVWTEIKAEQQNSETLAVICEENVQIQLLDYTKVWEYDTVWEVRQAILKDCFQAHYDLKQDTLFTAFNAKDLTFKRNITIQQTKWQGIEFEKVAIENVNINAQTIGDAHLWRNELLIKGIQQHIFSEAQFQTYDNDACKKFEAFHSLPSHTRESFQHEIGNKKENFYTVAKITSSQILSY